MSGFKARVRVVRMTEIQKLIATVKTHRTQVSVLSLQGETMTADVSCVNCIDTLQSALSTVNLDRRMIQTSEGPTPELGPLIVGTWLAVVGPYSMIRHRDHYTFNADRVSLMKDPHLFYYKDRLLRALYHDSLTVYWFDSNQFSPEEAYSRIATMGFPFLVMNMRTTVRVFGAFGDLSELASNYASHPVIIRSDRKVACYRDYTANAFLGVVSQGGRGVVPLEGDAKTLLDTLLATEEEA